MTAIVTEQLILTTAMDRYELYFMYIASSYSCIIQNLIV